MSNFGRDTDYRSTSKVCGQFQNANVIYDFEMSCHTLSILHIKYKRKHMRAKPALVNRSS